MNAFLGIESSDGDPCDCCGTPCPKRRTVVRTEAGDIRKLGSTCAALTLRPSDRRKAHAEEAAFGRIERAKSKARKWLADGFSLDRVRNWLGCYVRCEVREGSIVMHRPFGGAWITEAL